VYSFAPILDRWLTQSLAVHLRGWGGASKSAGVISIMENIANTNIPDRPEGTPMDKRINPEPDSKERGEKIADEIAHKGAQREHEYDDQQKPFNK